MDYEKNKEALAIVKQMVADGQISQEVAEKYFPELAESEDEKIRKEIIDFATKANNGVTSILANNYNFNKWIAWLEKKAEQKSADNVEPKFKVGDWIIDVQDVSANQIIGYEDDSYHIKTSCSDFYLPMKLAEKNYRLWTIQDAKDGDVVVDKSDGTIGIFQSIGSHPDGGCYNDPSYCFLHCHCEDEFFYADFENGNEIDSDDLVPATKEQCDTLMKAMTDAGYTFDFEKKELRKIEQKSAEWSEQDERKYNNIIALVEGKAIMRKDIKGLVSWFKSLKERIQPEKGWIPIKESFYTNNVVLAQKKDKSDVWEGYTVIADHTLDPLVFERYINIENISTQSLWRPSDEQMDALNDVISSRDIKYDVLSELWKDLKKLTD